MSLPRFYLDAIEGELLQLTGAEARHAARARRLAVGERVCVFDAAGGEAIGSVVAVTREAVVIRVEQRHGPVLPAGPRLTVATAIPKGPRAEWMIEKLAELGAAAVWPLICRRSVVTPGAGRVEKWRRAAREANKQSGRSDPMAIEEPATLEAVVARVGEFARVWWAEREGEGFVPGSHADASMLVFVGSEGGFDAAEQELLRRAGARPLRLGRHILRVETAAVAAAALFAASGS